MDTVHEWRIDHQKIAISHLTAMSEKELDENWKMNDFFGSVFIINLPSATDRLAKIIADIQQIGLLDYEVFKAVHGQTEVDEKIWIKFRRNWKKWLLDREIERKKFREQRQGEAGCYLSHYGVIRTMKERFDQAMIELKIAANSEQLEAAMQRLKKCSSVLIMEDDNHFGIVKNGYVTHERAGVLFRKAMQELPLKWDMLYFMAYSTIPSTTYSPHLQRLSWGKFANAYAVNCTMYAKVLQHLGRIFDEDVNEVYNLDNALAELHCNHACYCISPSIAYQYDGYSYILQCAKEENRQFQPAK